jgi:hypothetical protein
MSFIYLERGVYKDTTLPITCFSLNEARFVAFNICDLRKEIHVISNLAKQFRTMYRRGCLRSIGPYTEHRGYKGE